MIGLLFGVLSSPAAAGAAETRVSELIKGLRSPDESARLEAIDTLGLMGPKAAEAVSPLRRLLNDDSAAVRAHAAESLGEIGAPAKSAAAALVSLVGDPEAAVCREAIDALARIRPGPELTIPLMSKVLKDAEDDSVRIRALSCLADLGEEAVPFLMEALKDDEAAYWACLVLSESGPGAKDAVPALTGLVGDEEHEVAREAILALAAIGAPAAPAVPALVKALDDDVNRVPAVYALGSIGNVPGDVKERIKRDARGADDVLQTVSIWALARWSPGNERLIRRATELLIERLTDEDPRAREAAARALIDLDPDPEIARPLMTKAMALASPEALDDILDALASLGEKAVPRLAEALKHEEVCAKAAAVVARIGPAAKDAVPALIEALGDENPQTRNEVLFALAAIGPGAEAAVPAATDALNDPDANVRYSACYALGKIGAAAMPAEAALQTNLDDDDRFLSMVSAWALARIHPECSETARKSVPLLADALAGPDALTRAQAAESLGCLGPLAKDAVAALRKALGDDNEQVRNAAAEALKAIGR